MGGILQVDDFRVTKCSQPVWSSLPAILELANAVRGSLSEAQRNRRLANEIYKSLRQIYIMPDGVLSLLKDIQRGNKISKRRLEMALPAFNDKQWKIERAKGSAHNVADDLKDAVKDANK